ncbi:MAG: cation transporter, partial [Methanoregulaceae archaeon]|nr:cation transporter [Methanoregulaceae archaeon]
VILVIATVYRLLVPAPLGTGGVVLGVVVLVVIIGTNIFFWVRNYRIACLDPSPLMDSQWRLFRMKAFANLVVLFALLLSLLCAGLPWAVYIDPLGSFVVIGFLLQSGYRMISASLPDLLDRTLEEELQLVVVSDLAEHFHFYEQIHGVRSRRSGGRIYIEVFLEFDGRMQMCDVQDVIDRIKDSLESKIPGSSVNIVPTSGRCRDVRL